MWVLFPQIKIWKDFPRLSNNLGFRVILLSRNLPSQFSKIALKPKIMESRGKSFHIMIRGINTHHLSLISTWFLLIKWIWIYRPLLNLRQLTGLNFYCVPDLPGLSNIPCLTNLEKLEPWPISMCKGLKVFQSCLYGYI